MRIIGGRLRGRKLQSFKGSQVRPTADRVREALFNIIGGKVLEASVLDLFSGTGALGIEALSRGASMGVFVDNSARSLAVLQKNLDLCNLHPCTRMIRWDIAKSLNCLQAYPHTFDLVFMDPPYRCGLVPLAMQHLLQSQCLAPEALLVAEHEALAPPNIESSHLICTDTRRYGRTGISLFAYHAH